MSLTLPPEWVDVRGFTWAGMRCHVRYTYRGNGLPEYEKRIRLRPAIISGEIKHEADDWWVVTSCTGDTEVTCVCDWRTVYYWQANKGGSWHPECLDGMVKYANRQGKQFDLVGCNSPKRGLFKRGFGGALTPYYFVTTGDPKLIDEFWPPQETQVA